MTVFLSCNLKKDSPHLCRPSLFFMAPNLSVIVIIVVLLVVVLVVLVIIVIVILLVVIVVIILIVVHFIHLLIVTSIVCLKPEKLYFKTK